MDGIASTRKTTPRYGPALIKFGSIGKFKPNIIQALDEKSDFYQEIDKTTDKLIPLRK